MRHDHYQSMFMKPVDEPINVKRANGRYYTTKNPFKLKPFKKWAKHIKITEHKILEPFAGANNIIKMLKQENPISFCSFDILPQDSSVMQKDTIENFPTGYKTCITNPPWLASYSAKRKGVNYPNIKYDNVYKHCLEIALKNCENVCFIIPATYLRTALFRDRLHSVIFINDNLFLETENPVCIALFTKKSNECKIYYDDNYVGTLQQLESFLPKPKEDKKIKFNSKKGNLGLICIDNIREPSIRFCDVSEISRDVKHSDRSITKIECDVDDIEKSIIILNRKLALIRKNTQDVFLAPFKGLRKDGHYRRRIDYDLVRRMINAYC